MTNRQAGQIPSIPVDNAWYFIAREMLEKAHEALMENGDGCYCDGDRGDGRPVTCLYHSLEQTFSGDDQYERWLRKSTGTV